MLYMNRLPVEKRAQIVGMLVEGVSLRATSRLADVSINTVSKLLFGMGAAALSYQNEIMRGLTCKRIQVDEIWAFCYAKQKNVPIAMQGKFGYGDVWTWVPIETQTKLVPCWLIGDRSAESATMLMRDLQSRLANRVQLTTDGHKAYLTAVEEAFGPEVDFSQLVKLYGAVPEPDTRYSPGECIGCKREQIMGNPDPLHVSTSFVERQNLTMRMSMRRFARLTNAFSKKIENHAAAVALHFMHYNFGRIHKTLRVTPAMEAGISDHLWSLEKIADLAK